jgi:acetyl-CoA acetyltransferase
MPINKNNDIVICKGLRTPFNDFSIDDSITNSASIIKHFIKTNSLPPEMIGEILICSDSQTAYDQLTAFKIRAGLTHETPAIYLPMQGISPLQSIKLSSMFLKQGDIDCLIAAGVDGSEHHNSNYELFSAYCDKAATQSSINKFDQDKWAYLSHKKYSKYLFSNGISAEIYSGSDNNSFGNRSSDKFLDKAFTPNTTEDRFYNSEPKQGLKSITPFNSSIPTGGSASLLIMTRQSAKEFDIEPQATIATSVSISVDPEQIAHSIAFAIQIICKKANLPVDDVSLININEDFACLPLITLKTICGDDNERFNKLKNITNINGGSLSCGNPSFSIGFRLIIDAINGLKRMGGSYAICAVCDGISQAEACLIRI